MILSRSLLIFLAIPLSLSAASLVQVADWRMSSIRSDENGITVADLTGNGYGFTIPKGAKIATEPGAPSPKVLQLDGSISDAIRIPINMVELANLHIALRFKPSGSSSTNSEIIGCERWRVRYNGAKKVVDFYVTRISKDKTPPRVVLELKVKPDEWNLMVADILPDHVELRVNDQDALCTMSRQDAELTPIENIGIHLFRDFGSGQYVGSLSDFAVGYSPASGGPVAQK